MTQGMARNGNLIGPASSTDNAIARFDSTTGTVLQNSGVTIDDNNNLIANGLQTGGTSKIAFAYYGATDIGTATAYTFTTSCLATTSTVIGLWGVYSLDGGSSYNGRVPTNDGTNQIVAYIDNTDDLKLYFTSIYNNAIVRLVVAYLVS